MISGNGVAGVGPTKRHGALPHGVVNATRVGFTSAEAPASVTSVACLSSAASPGARARYRLRRSPSRGAR